MDNRSIARLLDQTGDLLEISGENPFRIRSYHRAAEAIAGLSRHIADMMNDEKEVLAIPGIGKGMLEHLKEIAASGEIAVHKELLKKYGAGILDLFKIQGLGPKTIALLWDAYQANDLASVEKLAKEGKIRTLPRMGEKAEKKILKGIEDFRRLSGRFLILTADQLAQQLIAHLAKTPGVEKVTPAGSLRRGRETVGDLDVLVTGKGCEEGSPKLNAIIARVLDFPGIAGVLAKGENKVSFRMDNGMQVDVRLLPPQSFGAALLYFTGSKNHNVVLRQRALKMGYTLNEYGLSALKGGKVAASKTEEEIYKKLGLEFIPPELRESHGEIEAAESGKLPELVELSDIHGDVHMHTVATDGRCTIEEMAEAARARGYRYMAITDHSKALAMANGLDDKRAMAHVKKIRAAGKKMDGIRILAGIEVDILADGSLDLSDSVLEEMDLVIASVHSGFNMEPERMTDRILKTLENPNVSILGHPTGRALLRRDAFTFDMGRVFTSAAKKKITMELNSSPERLDLNDVNLRAAKEHGLRFVINTDSHHTSHMDFIRFGILQARRAWLTKKDVLNTLPEAAFVKAMKRH